MSKKRPKWSQEDMSDAYNAVKDGAITITEAAQIYNVNRTTLSDKVHGKTPLVAKIGGPTYLPGACEDIIKNAILMANERCIGVTYQTVKEWVHDCLVDEEKAGNLKTPPAGFDGLYPSEKWVYGFLKRHKIVLRKPETYSRSRNNIQWEDVTHWFSMMKCYMSENGWDHILNHPSRNFNADETGVVLSDKPSKVS